jgi:hypothetical protein
VASKKNIFKYLCNEKTTYNFQKKKKKKKTYNIINEGCHIDFYGPNVGSLLHSSISRQNNNNNNNNNLFFSSLIIKKRCQITGGRTQLEVSGSPTCTVA